VDTVGGYKLDPAAKIDLVDLRYEWFNYVLKGGPKPSLLEDKVNYEVTGADTWEHAPTLAAMGKGTLRFHLTSVRSGDAYRLIEQMPSDNNFISQTVNLADRSDVDRHSPGGVRDKAVDIWNGVEFLSDPLRAPIEMSGLFSGELDFITNKTDFDFEIDLYEMTPNGDYIQLAPYWARASFVGDLSHRRLLAPGKRQHLNFQAVRLLSRQLEAGSRLVAVLRIIKQPGRQINYGTGKEVSDETVQDAKVPLEIKWYGASYVDVPVRR
jgi:hypothetical protein